MEQQIELDFSNALQLIRMGKVVARSGWNGKGMYLFLVPDWMYKDQPMGPCTNLPFIAMKTVQGDYVPWLASQTDILAIDWFEVTECSTNEL